jgi:hypothetical protein
MPRHDERAGSVFELLLALLSERDYIPRAGTSGKSVQGRAKLRELLVGFGGFDVLKQGHTYPVPTRVHCRHSLSRPNPGYLAKAAHLLSNDPGAARFTGASTSASPGAISSEPPPRADFVVQRRSSQFYIMEFANASRSQSRIARFRPARASFVSRSHVGLSPN